MWHRPISSYVWNSRHHEIQPVCRGLGNKYQKNRGVLVNRCDSRFASPPSNHQRAQDAPLALLSRLQLPKVQRTPKEAMHPAQAPWRAEAVALGNNSASLYLSENL